MPTRSPLVFVSLLTAVVGALCGCDHRQMGETLERQMRGAELYERMCAVCHGQMGRGYAADNAPAIGGAAFLGSATDKFLHDAIADGRTGTTMSSWGRAHGGPLSDRDVDAIVAFMRLWPHRPARLDTRPLQGDAGRGGEIYARECVRCHGAAGKAGPMLRVGNPELLAAASDGFL
ncbi:MAG: c-type cytochrome, partial [Polyangiaceae bacterium]|nr:c-type cytochrome [Polyangiaceae bacterium]